jgi:uncharacterized coiled-coil protein SlyX
MTKIKLLGALIFILSLVLAYYSKYISTQNEAHVKMLKVINEQKAFTQEISKNIFYIYNNKESSTKELDKSIKEFVENMNHREEVLDEIFSTDIQSQKTKIVKEWNKFYLLVQKFRDLNKVSRNAYTNIALEQVVKDIYEANLNLLIEFNKLIEMYKKSFDSFLYSSKIVQIILFVTLLMLLLYLFTQLKDVMAFIQKFLYTSKDIVSKSTVKEVKPIATNGSVEDISKAADNFNYLVKKIDDSIEFSSASIENASNSLELIEKNIEDLLELVAAMDTQNSYDKEMIKKEDILIEALEELTTSLKKLQKLKENLDNFKK